jgi:predicted nucleotidyltransferase
MNTALLDLVRGRRQEVLGIATKYGAKNVRVFGSVARGDSTDASDVDLLVDLDSDRSLSDLGEFQEDVRDLLQHTVHAVSTDGLHRLLKDRILREAVPL